MAARPRKHRPPEGFLSAVVAMVAALALLAGCGSAAGTTADAEPDVSGAQRTGAGDEAAEAAPGEDREPPNIIVIPTDDLAVWDLDAAALEKMPNIREELIEGGTTFENAFVTNSVCCPSRATFLRGQYAHNHQVLTNAPPLGGADRFRISGGDGSTAATWLQEEGYRTAFFGKYLNAYGGPTSRRGGTSGTPSPGTSSPTASTRTASS